ncbi:ion channel [Aquibacillus sp. 3ASR75-11]|uniref:Ion channel n=1 Tax=Terrihalobacillus insolitus TaxID=2950438 RepID=A0A9X3WWH6_9BACI|nr:potassium channel family protein [Terrihalobacillus insolitus]MDC3415091.1 ion channel [Terrihalobacillus insolitus]MDC3426088.1 ion channel [Terrihalobacillus insolitus]
MYFFRKVMLRMIKVNNSLLFGTSFLLILFTSYLVVEVEPETFSNYFDGFWWVMTTVTTVGYGDYFPVSIGGRVIALFLYVFGIGLIGVVIGKVVDGLASFRKKREEGDIVFKERNHYIIVGWSKKAKYAINEMLDTKKDVEIVIIDDLERAPMLSANVHYIRGNASSEELLIQANVMEAKSVLIFADDRIDNSELCDGKTLLIASAIEAVAPSIHTVVEIIEERHIRNFEYMKVNEFIISHETISSLFVRSAFMNGISSVYGQLLSRSHGDDLYHIPALPHWKTYRDAFDELLGVGATLIADKNDLSINRTLDNEIKTDSELYVICDKNTYNRFMKKVQEK